MPQNRLFNGFASRISSLVVNRTVAFLLFFNGATFAAVTWPSGQILPSFSPPAATLDYPHPASADETTLFASLKGVVNATQPRIVTYEGDTVTTWMQDLGLSWVQPADKWSLITKYLSEIPDWSSLIVICRIP